MTSTMRKGKRTPQALPNTAIGLIVAHTATAGVYVPTALAEHPWGTRVWFALHHARALATLRAVSRAWRAVVDAHPAWRVLCATFDPLAALPRSPPPQVLPTPPGVVPSQALATADSFRAIIRETCIVCAISCPDGTAYRRRAARYPAAPTGAAPSALFRLIPTCATHRPLAFCAWCLRAEPATLGFATAPQLALAPLAANERDAELTRALDLRAGAGVRAVCGGCRHERIRTELVRGRGVNMAPWMGSGFWEWEWETSGPDPAGWMAPWPDGSLCARDASRLLRTDEIAAVVSQYVEYGDWTVREAVDEMEERVWLRYWTKANEMEGLVRATARLQRMEERAEELRERARQRQVFAAGGELGLGLGVQNTAPGLDMSLDVLGNEYADDESDEDDDLLSLSDEFGLREMIFQDWARNRILEGIWLSPHLDIASYHTAASNNPEMRTLPSRVAPRHPLSSSPGRTPPTLPRRFQWTVITGVRERDDSDRSTQPSPSPTQSSPNSPQPQQRRTYVHTPTNFYLSTPPPPSRLTYHLARAWESALRGVLGPALGIIVGRVVRECEAAERVWSVLDRTRSPRLNPNAYLATDGEYNGSVYLNAARGEAWDRLRVQCTLAQGERDPCKAVSRIGAEQLLDILKGPEAWIEGGGWEDLLVDEVVHTWEGVRAELEAEARVESGVITDRVVEPELEAPEGETQDEEMSPLAPSSAHTHSNSSDLNSSDAARSPSTMRTTPSPPPSVDGTKRGDSVVGGTPLMDPRQLDGAESVIDFSEKASVVDSSERSEESGTPQSVTPLRPPPVLPMLPTLSNSTARLPSISTRSPPLPLLKSPPKPKLSKPLHPIPLVPVCAHHIGQQTKTLIEMLWRESTGGLWMCRCSVCVRAMSVQGVPSVPLVQNQNQNQGVVGQVQNQGLQGHWQVNNAGVGGGEVDVPMEVEEVVEGKGKGVAGRRSRDREGDEDGGEGDRKRMKCEVKT
ncbi:hypothetical protein BDV93DRAFT_603044 [Ceratobasidium sp. AG-I]|nr:hypothetical protein BDV93DRAFT_603044 [Ceratobasidium sp. AG-I]